MNERPKITVGRFVLLVLALLAVKFFFQWLRRSI